LIVAVPHGVRHGIGLCQREAQQACQLQTARQRESAVEISYAG
jgi:hypothetical protein